MSIVIPPIDLNELAPGIRKTVDLLRRAGFDTCDSGDGSAYPSMECALPFAMVAIKSTPERMLGDTQALYALLKQNTLPSAWTPSEEYDEIPSVEGSYSPMTETAILVVLGIADKDLIPSHDVKVLPS